MKTPLSLLLFTAAIASANAHAQVCGATVYASLSLTADLVCRQGVNGIVIGADGVRIDLNGFSIRGPYTFTAPTRRATGVTSSGFEGVQIVGPGSITGFERPVTIVGGYNHVIKRVDIVSESGSPVSLRNASGAVIDSSRITAIEIASDRGSRATANRIMNNAVGQVDPTHPGGGIVLRGCGTSDNEVSYNGIDPGPPNVVMFGFRRAITLVEGTHSNQLLGNSITSGEVTLQGSSNNLIAGNKFANVNAATGFMIDSSGSPVACAGGAILPSDKNIVKDNWVQGGYTGVIIDGYQVLNAHHPNITVTVPSTGNLVNGNTFSDQGVSGMFFARGAINNDGQYNKYINVPADVYDLGSGNLWP